MEYVWDFLQQAGNFLSGMHQTYWALAIIGTVSSVILFIFALFGMGEGHGDAGDSVTDIHHDSGFSDFKLLSFRAILAFVTFFGWGGVLWGDNGWLGFIAALASGFSMMLVTAGVIFFMMKLQQTGNLRPNDMLGVTGTVYYNIPAGRVDSGKVTVVLKDRTRQIIAVADEDIPSGAAVRVESQVDGQRFLVKRV